MNLYKKCTAKTYSYLVNDTTLASNNTLRLRFNIFRKNKKTNYDNKEWSMNMNMNMIGAIRIPMSQNKF